MKTVRIDGNGWIGLDSVQFDLQWIELWFSAPVLKDVLGCDLRVSRGGKR